MEDKTEKINIIFKSLSDFFDSLNFNETWSIILASAVICIGIIIGAIVINIISSKILVKLISRLVKKTSTNWDDVIFKRGVFNRLSRLVPALFVFLTISLAFPLYESISDFIKRLAVAYMIIIVISVLEALISSVDDIYKKHEVSKRRPITGYLQILKIFLFIMGIGLVITTILNKSPIALLSGIGALSAVLLLVFKDSILGFVASIQLTANNMVRIGDWIEMPQYGADGDVIDVTLQSVKVQNWDKTITTIPIYSLVSGSFKNWRGMSESGGRRIKRSINIDIGSIKFCSKEMIANFKKFRHISEYISSKEKEIGEYNKDFKVDEAFLVNGRHLTNIGTFRAYLEGYLRNHPKISKDMTFLIRQLPAVSDGLPIEIYVFCSDTAWVNYEGIQADIFDHIFAVIPEFELRVFQNPSGADLKNIKC